MTDPPERNDNGDTAPHAAGPAERGWPLPEVLPGEGGPGRELPEPDPFWLTLLATLSALVLPAATAIGAVLLLGPPNIPHTSDLAAIAAGALTLAEAVFAGLVAGALVEAAWTRLRLPGSSPVHYLPLRWVRQRMASRRLVALSAEMNGGGAGSGRVARLCARVGRSAGLSSSECDQAAVAALVDRGVAEQVHAPGGTTDQGRLRLNGSLASERLAAVVGAYDALRCDQPDRPALSRPAALAELRAMAGTGLDRLDPDLVEALIEVETANRRRAAVPLLAIVGSTLARLWRRGRHIARTSVTPAAAGATLLAMGLAGALGVLPAWRGTRVLALRYPAPSVVVQATPTPITDDPSSPPATPTPSPSAPSPQASGTGPVGQVPGIYFPPQHTAPRPPPARPTPTAPAVTPHPEPSPSSVSMTPPPITVVMPTPTPSDPSGVVAERVVSANHQGSFTTMTSPPLSTTSANELILAFVSSDSPANGSQSVSSVSGGGLSWSLAARANTVTGTAEVWQAYATAPLPGAAVVATLASSGRGGSITVAAFRGAAPAVGAAAVGSAASGAPQVALTTTRAGSLVWAAGQDPDLPVPRSPLSGQKVVHESFDLLGGGATWVQSAGPVTEASAVVTVGDSAPTVDHWDLVAVEIPPAG